MADAVLWRFDFRGIVATINLLNKKSPSEGRKNSPKGEETVVADEVAPKLIDKIVDEINTGHFGDGKIFVYDVEDAIRIRTGEHGTKAL